MAKIPNASSMITYGPVLPAAGTASDGALFFKTAPDGLGPRGLYLFGFIQDDLPAFGNQVAQKWAQAVAVDLFVLRTGDTMSGILEIATPNTDVIYDAGEGSLVLRNTSINDNARSGAIKWKFGTSLNTSAQIDAVQIGSVNQAANLTFGTRAATGNIVERMRLGAAGMSVAGALAIAGQITAAGQTVWNAGNDGAGTGLDADLLDGLQATAFVLKSGDSMTGPLTVSPNGAVAQNIGAVTVTNPANANNYLGFTVVRAGTFSYGMGINSSNELFFSTAVVNHAGSAPIGTQLIRVDGSGNFVAQGNITAYSDARLKENIEVISGALDKVDQIRGVTYNRVGHPERRTGVIAQELQTVLPEAVAEDVEGMLSVAYGNVIGLLVEAIKELRAEVKELKSKN